MNYVCWLGMSQLVCMPATRTSVNTLQKESNILVAEEWSGMNSDDGPCDFVSALFELVTSNYRFQVVRVTELFCGDRVE